MALKINDIIRGPVLTDRAYKLNRTLKQLVVRVHPDANKPQIKQAVESLFNVKVKQVRTLNRAGKRKRAMRKFETVGPRLKKAIITLAHGHELDLISGAGATVTINEKTTQAA